MIVTTTQIVCDHERDGQRCVANIVAGSPEAARFKADSSRWLLTNNHSFCPAHRNEHSFEVSL